MNNPVADRPIKRSNVSLRGALLLLMGLFIATTVNAQGWELTFGDDNEDQGQAVIQTSDHGYLIVGFSESFGPDNDLDIYVIRTDVDGTELWSNVYDEGLIEHAYEVIETEDKGFLIIGDINYGFGQPTDVYLLKISQTGAFEWSKNYGNPNVREQGNDIAKAFGDGYAIIGLTRDTPGGDNDIQLIRIDNAGNVLWKKNYGSENDNRGNALAALPDGGFAFVGTTKDESGIDNDMIIYRVDENGEMVWSKTFGWPNIDESANDVILANNGTTLVLVGSVQSESVAYLRRYDLEGNVLGLASIDLGAVTNSFNSAVELADGSIVATGYTLPNNADVNVLIAKINPADEVVWATQVGAVDKTDTGESIAATVDGGFVITGHNSQTLLFINDVTLIKVDALGNLLTNNIQGRVYRSIDDCDEFEAGDTPLPRWTVTAASSDKTYITITDEEGFYNILVDTGIYTVTVLPYNPNWSVCNEAGFEVSLLEGYNNAVFNFPVTGQTGCVAMEVGVAADFLAVCDEVGYYVTYSNDGTITASNAYVEVELDEELTYLSSTIPPSNINGNVYTFQLGEVNSTEFGFFKINAAMACDGIAQGQATLVTAHIYPDTLCLEPDPNWDMSSIVVGGYCENDSIKFFIRNVGNGNMIQPKLSFVVEDDVIMFSEPFQLPSTQETLIGLEGNGEGSTYRLIAQQSDGHPGVSFPTVAVEGCAQGEYTTGFVSDFPEDDGDPFIAINVQEVSGSGLPIALRGHPTGYQDSILARNTDITYTISFRNDGTDTISRVVIRDTLPTNLDFTSLTFGPSSHPYNAQLYGNGILKITFEEIQLQPNGSAQEAQSRGFVTFRIAQKLDLPLESIIDNRAAVYFDYVEPVVTNTVHHVIGCTDLFQEGCITVNIDPTPEPAGLKITVQPNPFANVATIKIDGPATGKTFNFEVYDITGKLVRSNRFTENHFDFHRGGLAPGMYLYRIQSEGSVLGSGKILVQ